MAPVEALPLRFAGAAREPLGPPDGETDVSVVIVAHNTRDALRDCLESLEPDRRALAIQVVVVDSASGDETGAMLEASFPWVEPYLLDENVGFARATNIGLRASRGTRLVLLNPDTVLSPGALSSVVRELDRWPEVGMVGCKLVRPDGSLDHACKRGIPSPASALAYFLRLDRLPLLGAHLGGYQARGVAPDEVGFVGAVSGAFMVVRREALEAVGGLDERFWMYGEDIDWCLRFWRAGWPVLYWPGVEVLHVKGASSAGPRPRVVNRAFHESMWLFYDKHHRGALRATRALVRAGIALRYALVESRATLRRSAAWSR